ncbi:MAG: NADH-ubiquinone oxidoreductase chain F, partial [uncultured Blastococcus sp.]
APHTRAHHPLGRRPVLAAVDLRAARGLRGPPDGAVDGARRAGHAGQGLGPARPGRRRLPDRHEVELHPAAQAGGEPDRPGGHAQVPRGQRRRGRAGHLQGPAADDGRPALAHRGRDHLRLRDPVGVRRHLRPRRGGARPPPAGGRRGGGLCRRLPRRGHPRFRLRPGAGRARRRGCLHLRRGDGAARLARGLPRPAPAQAAVPRRRRPLRRADGHQQRRDPGQRPVRRARRRRLVQGVRAGEVARPQDLLAVGPCRPPGPVRGPHGDHDARAARDGRRRAPGPRAEVLDAGRLLDAVLHRRAPRRPARLRLRRRGRLHARHHRADGVRRDRFDRRGHPAVHRVLRARELRQVHPVPRGHLLAGPDPRADRERTRHRPGPRPAGRHLRQHPRPLVLRPRRRRHELHLQLAEVLQGRLRRPPAPGGAGPAGPLPAHRAREGCLV